MLYYLRRGRGTGHRALRWHPKDPALRTGPSGTCCIYNRIRVEYIVYNICVSYTSAVHRIIIQVFQVQKFSSFDNLLAWTEICVHMQTRILWKCSTKQTVHGTVHPLHGGEIGHTHWHMQSYRTHIQPYTTIKYNTYMHIYTYTVPTASSTA